jgi:paired amphipathic helix protein Sin3a
MHFQVPGQKIVTIQWMQKDETTFDLDDMERKDRWQYYTSSFVRIEPTEGVSRGRMNKSVLERNLPPADTGSEEGAGRKPLVFEEDLILRICVNSYKINFKPGGSESFIYADKPLTWDEEKNTSSARARLQKFEDTRNEGYQGKFVMNNKWMQGLSHDEVQKITSDTKKWFQDGVVPGTIAPLAEP